MEDTRQTPNNLTPREMEILCLAYQCFKAKPEVPVVCLALATIPSADTVYPG